MHVVCVSYRSSSIRENILKHLVDSVNCPGMAGTVNGFGAYVPGTAQKVLLSKFVPDF